MGNIYPHIAPFFAIKMGICFRRKGHKPRQMSTEGGGPKSMLKSRAENFARHLQSRLRSLSESEDGTWTSAADVPSLSPSSETETFFEIDSNITSPEEEITEPEYTHTNHIADLHLCDRGDQLTRLDSGDDQFFDTVDPDDTHRPEESSQVEDTCQCRPNPSDAPRNHRCTNLPDTQLNGFGKTYSDAELSNPVCESCSKLETVKIVVNCNGCEDAEVSEDEVDSSKTKCTEEVSETQIYEAEDIPNCQDTIESKTLDEHVQTMSKPEPEVDEKNLSLSDLLQVIHKELKLEGKQNAANEANRLEIPETSKPTKPADEEEEDIETRRLRFRRCSSLKSGKTPPGTPGRKKIVRFADVLGLDLADVKTFLDEVPTIPKSAYEDLYGVESSSQLVEPFEKISQPIDRRERVVIPLFQQPGGHPNFLDRLHQLNVCLENAVVSDPSLLAITGTVRVKNIDFHKSVHVRYTHNNWKSFADLQARYVPNSCDGFSDKFSFLMYAHTLVVGQRLEFAVRFQARGTQYWDNNGGVNYVFECVSRDNPCITSTPAVPPSPLDSWPAFY